jgi:hypothetical protein
MADHMKNALIKFFPSESQYAARDPLLFGDFRNSMLKEESRDYEDLLDFKAVYHLFIEVSSRLILFMKPHTPLFLIYRVLDLV